jgi:asparagine synthase (glutamine-hydrolysing)
MALVSAGLADGQVDHAAVAEYLAFEYVPPPRTGVAGVEQIEPGTAMRRTAHGHETVERWTSPVFRGGGARRENVSIRRADAIVGAAVKRQLKADVEVGVFLSGGVDSSLILDHAVQAGARPVALTVMFRGHGDYDESQAARLLTRRLGVPHHVTTIDFGFAEAIDEVAGAYDSPFADASAIATLPLARLAREHVTVALSGTGGDDLFAGYYRHRAHRMRPVAQHIPNRVRSWLCKADPGQGSERKSVGSLARSYGARLAAVDARTDAALYLGLVGGSTGPSASSALTQDYNPVAIRNAVASRHGLVDGRLGLNEIQNFELRTYLPGDLLVKEDRATMAHSVEGRVPLLDAEVVSLASITPERQRARLFTGKALLRALARRRGLDAAARGRKRGFAVPLASLFAGEWRADATTWLRSQASTLVDGRLVAEQLESGTISAQEAWTLSALMGWERRLSGERTGAVPH